MHSPSSKKAQLPRPGSIQQAEPPVLDSSTPIHSCIRRGVWAVCIEYARSDLLKRPAVAGEGPWAEIKVLIRRSYLEVCKYGHYIIRCQYLCPMHKCSYLTSNPLLPISLQAPAAMKNEVLSKHVQMRRVDSRAIQGSKYGRLIWTLILSVLSFQLAWKEFIDGLTHWLAGGRSK